MSCLQFFSTNLIDIATITPSTVNLSFPDSNLTDPRRSKVYRSTTSTDDLVLDFGSAKNIDSVFVVDEPRSGFGINSFTFDINSSNSWGSPAYTDTISLSTQYGMGYKIFTNQNYRYVRLNLASAGTFCELSKVFVGKSIDLGVGPKFNWSYQDKELSTIKENRYGQRFVDVISRQKVINMQLSLLSKTQLEQIFELYDNNSTTKPFFVSLGDDVMITDHRRFSGMVFFNSIPTITNTSFGRYSISMQLEEAM